MKLLTAAKTSRLLDSLMSTRYHRRFRHLSRRLTSVLGLPCVCICHLHDDITIYLLLVNIDSFSATS